VSTGPQCTTFAIQLAAMAAEVATPLELDPARTRVLGGLKAHGWNSTSFQVLEPGFSYWFDDSGCVAYVDTGSAWVAAGAPIAAAARLGECARRFAAAGRAKGRRVCFFAVEERFLESSGFSSGLIGEQPVWDPGRLAKHRPGSRSLREQLRRARAKGVVVRRVDDDEMSREESSTRRAVEALIQRWSETRTLAPMGFLVAVHPFHFAEERRYFVAERDGAIVAFLAMVPVYARQGWLLEDFLRDPTAPNGTVELVIDRALRDVGEEGARYATLGLAPLSGDVNGWLRAIRDASTELYDFHGLRAFKAKLRPDRWDPIHLAYPERQWGPLAVYDVLRAFSRVGLLRFGIETFLRVPGTVLQLATLLIAPWLVVVGLWAAGLEVVHTTMPPSEPTAGKLGMTLLGVLPGFAALLVFGALRRRRRHRHVNRSSRRSHPRRTADHPKRTP